MSRSHFIVVDALLKGLAAKGHQVTVISAFPPEHDIPNYRHIIHNMALNYKDKFKSIANNEGKKVGVSQMIALLESNLIENEALLQNVQMQKLMNETFDLVIVEFMGETLIGLAAHFNCPLIMFSSIKPTYYVLDIMGNPLALSYVRNPYKRDLDLSSFKGRFINVMSYMIASSVHLYFYNKKRSDYTKYFPSSQYPSFDDVLKNHLSAVFVTHHYSQGDVRPLVPGIIEVSGIQMANKSSPLPSDLQTWMDNSVNGVIYFSFGTNINIGDLVPNKLDDVIHGFGSLKENVLWKTNIDMEMPPNVRIVKWIPQIDVLQHKNLKLFITHAGLGSIMESKFYGIPLLMIPIFFDQTSNAEIVANEGWGIKLDYHDLNDTNFYSSIRELIDNVKYAEQAKYESQLYRDRPIAPLDNGIFWTEYIIRHKGAKHLRSKALDMNWFQLHSIDVLGFICLMLIILIFFVFKFFKFVIKTFYSKKIIKHKLN